MEPKYPHNLFILDLCIHTGTQKKRENMNEVPFKIEMHHDIYKIEEYQRARSGGGHKE